ncbi:LOW QUALITY PROTEIN: putative cytochrome P450 [Aspergillus udagawae]|uniref:Putative cytochrome P450 n=1 Tax=Aspergillus udagawae TaxID=91492 RepID=A0A8H3SGS3_9EURO|nr:LOW QUALITY PROTEIN: putative cytochrome P450 [Aspergillus udagawae]
MGGTTTHIDLTKTMLVYLVFLGIFCVVGLFIYRLYFHPLHKFPGSKLASLSGLYEFYFDVVKDGSYIWEIEKMHDKYGLMDIGMRPDTCRMILIGGLGPVIRINPNELHIKDSASYNEIYCGGRDKYRASTRAFGTPESTHETISYRHHQQRRKLLQGHFSKRAVMQLQPLIESKVDKLIHRLAKSKEDVEPVDLQAGFAALATDIISEHVCGTAYGCLHEADFQNDVRDQVLEWESSFQLVRLLPIFSFFKSYPFSLLHKLNPRPAKICLLEDKIRHHIMNAVELKGLPHSDVIAALTGTHVPAEEKTATRIQDECGFLLRAGTETTSRAFAVTMFYLLESPDIFQKLHSELKAAMPVATKYPRLTELESLPYLRAVIFEGIRLSVGLLTRLPRVATDEALQYNGWTIPKGVSIHSQP